MKELLILMFTLSMLVALARGQGTVGELSSPSQGGTSATGTPGVQDDTCWKTSGSSGHEVEVDVSGGIHGDYKLKVTEGDHSGSATATPDPDGGVSDSGDVDVDGESYRAKDGKMQWDGPNGWVDISKTTCDDPPDTSPVLGDDETIGSLPFAMMHDAQRDEYETIGSLPA